MSDNKESKPDHDKAVSIIVNGRTHQVAKERISYEEVVSLRYQTEPRPTGPNILITVMYSKGHSDQQGSLEDGDAGVKVKEGMVFNVTATDKS